MDCEEQLRLEPRVNAHRRKHTRRHPTLTLARGTASRLRPQPEIVGLIRPIPSAGTGADRLEACRAAAKQ